LVRQDPFNAFTLASKTNHLDAGPYVNAGFQGRVGESGSCLTSVQSPGALNQIATGDVWRQRWNASSQFLRRRSFHLASETGDSIRPQSALVELRFIKREQQLCSLLETEWYGTIRQLFVGSHGLLE
jgi:hypothetical protein